MNGCQEYELLFSAQLDGELSPEETARLDRHLAQCPACRRLARELACIHTELEDMTAEPPADLTDRILAQLPPVSPPPVPAAPSELQAPRRTLSRLVCATAAALVLLGEPAWRCLTAAPPSRRPPRPRTPPPGRKKLRRNPRRRAPLLKHPQRRNGTIQPL